MTKRTFIKNLKERLAILDSKEVDDIVLEYTNIIDDKMKDGKTEKEAILDFGDIDELASEILKAYKVNPNYGKHDDKIDLNECKDNFEDWVKRGASKLTEVTKNAFNEIKEKDSDFSVETVFEIIIKAIVLLVILAVLKLPFMLIESLGDTIIYSAFFPLSHVLGFIWSMLVWVLYIIACVFVGIAMFKKNITIEKEVKKEIKKEKTKPEKKVEKVETPKKESNIGSLILSIIKVFVFICLILPIWLVNLGLILAIVVIAYYLCLGIDLWGILVVLLGCLLISGHLSHIINNILNNRKNYYFVPFAIGMALLVLGGLITAHSVRYYDYEYASFDLATKKFEYVINYNATLELDGHYIIQIDNDMPVGNVVVEASYYDEFIDVSDWQSGNRIEIYDHSHISNRDFWKAYDKVIEGLKNKKFVILDDLEDTHYKVYVNEATLRNLRIID